VGRSRRGILGVEVPGPLLICTETMGRAVANEMELQAALDADEDKELENS
jgi:hypothetical protein